MLQRLVNQLLELVGSSWLIVDRDNQDMLLDTYQAMGDELHQQDVCIAGWLNGYNESERTVNELFRQAYWHGGLVHGRLTESAMSILSPWLELGWVETWDYEYDEENESIRCKEIPF